MYHNYKQVQIIEAWHPNLYPRGIYFWMIKIHLCVGHVYQIGKVFLREMRVVVIVHTISAPSAGVVTSGHCAANKLYMFLPYATLKASSKLKCIPLKYFFIALSQVSCRLTTTNSFVCIFASACAYLSDALSGRCTKWPNIWALDVWYHYTRAQYCTIYIFCC